MTADYVWKRALFTDYVEVLKVEIRTAKEKINCRFEDSFECASLINFNESSMACVCNSFVLNAILESKLFCKKTILRTFLCNNFNVN